MANTDWWNIEWYTKSDTEDLDPLRTMFALSGYFHSTRNWLYSN